MFREMEESYNFNPRLREGGDEKTKTATIIPFDFNPRLREGGDQYRSSCRPDGTHFNPRLREGGDKCYCFTFSTIFNFNPRLREGGDASILEVTNLTTISIHASAKEATIVFQFRYSNF